MKTNCFGTFLDTVRTSESKRNKKWLMMFYCDNKFIPEVFSLSDKKLKEYTIKRLKNLYDKEISIINDNGKIIFNIEGNTIAYIMEIPEV